jgi:rod shape-determining protein MreD
MRRRLIWLGSIILCFILQLQPIYIKAAKIDFLLIVLILFTVKYGYFKGGILGFFLGLLEDMVSLQYLGVNAFSKTLICAVVGLSDKIFYTKRIEFCIIACFIATYFDNFFNILLKMGMIEHLTRLLNISLQEGIYNCVIVSLLFTGFKKYLSNGNTTSNRFIQR